MRFHPILHTVPYSTCDNAEAIIIGGVVGSLLFVLATAATIYHSLSFSGIEASQNSLSSLKVYQDIYCHQCLYECYAVYLPCRRRVDHSMYRNTVDGASPKPPREPTYV